MRAPDFWQHGASAFWPTLLAPAALFYRLGFLARAGTARPQRASIPVICVGAATLGGAGKTPLTAALARRLRQQGRKVHIVTRGYGGSERGPLLVDPGRHGASDVGDEALLLLQAAPTWVARDRAAGARAAAEAGADLVLLDDGLQNPTLAKTFSFLAVDGATGFGNGRLLPAGPLREPVAAAAARCQAAVIIGKDEAGVAAQLPASLPRLNARIEPIGCDALKGRRWLAFCGLGRPAKFRRTLEEIGLDLAGWRAFPDHHHYSERELAGLRAEAARLTAGLLTTRKDWVRLRPDDRSGVTPLDIVLRFEEEAELDRLLQSISKR
jgi:tetraacyldisaccharide 4'-kinase